MPNNDEVLAMIADGGKLTAIADLTGWPKGQVVALARDNGYGLNVSSDRFQPGPQAKPKPQGIVRHTTRDLIEEGRASSVVKVQRAAAKAQQAIDTLAELLDETRAAEAAKKAEAAERAKLQAEVDELARQLEEKRARLRAPRAKSATAALDTADPKTVRAWAASNGIDCPATGRVPRAVVEQWQAAQAAEAGAA